MHFTFAFGGIISPIISAPFLSQEDTENHTLSSNSTSFSITEILPIAHINSSSTPVYVVMSNTSTPSTRTSNIAFQSEVYKAYSIIAAVSLSSAISFLVLYFQSDETTCPTTKEVSSESHHKEKLPLRLKVAVLIVLAFIIAFYTAVEDTYAGFLTTFTVKYYRWKKSRGSFATSVFWTSFAIGRFTGIFFVNFFRQARLLRVYSLLLISAFICLVLTSVFHKSDGIWAASIVAGFAMSIFFPIFFSWTEEKFFHVDGKVTALIMACAMIGVIINPIILGRVMETSTMVCPYTFD